jgi:UDP-2-acetamido-2,6-beta-L-arabino-hexul-4-ose reductase
MNVLITGPNGFIAKNLIMHLKHMTDEKITIFKFHRNSTDEELIEGIQASDFIFHLAGENRPNDDSAFTKTNVDLTRKLCDLASKHNPIPILFTSSTQATADNPYGKTKLAAEKLIEAYSKNNNVSATIYRLPNVFGKWSRPNYNSFVATLCHNIPRNIPVNIDDKSKTLKLGYIDDLIKDFIDLLQVKTSTTNCNRLEPNVTYNRTLGEIISLIDSYKETPISLQLPEASNGFERALYATYMSFIPKEQFSYPVVDYTDDRGSFYEVLKTQNNGQISISTTLPGITRGNHFHHSKIEKFLVVKGKALFKFRHMITEETIEILTTEKEKRFVEVPAGYTHSFQNTGEEDLVILLWANEVFDRTQPDTYTEEVTP